MQLPTEIAPALGATGPIAGVVVIEAEQVELLDAHALFADEAFPPPRERLCWLQADGSGWMETFLRPMLEASGYRCVTQPPPGVAADVALVMDDANVAPEGALNVVRLRRDIATAGHSGSIYRYDRSALLDALAIAVGGAR